MITYKLKLFKSRSDQKGVYPIVLQLTDNRKTYRINTGYKSSLKDFSDKKGLYKRSVDNYQIKNENLQDNLLLASRIIDDFRRKRKPFNLEIFKNKFKRNNSAVGVYEFFDTIKEELRLKGNLKNADMYYEGKRSLLKYKPNINLSFNEIDYNFLKGYETYLLGVRKVMPSTVRVYIRTLRAAYREAMRRGYVDMMYYPFSGELNPSGYSMKGLKCSSQPRAIAADDMDKIKAFDHEANPKLSRAIYLFQFSYFAFGINLKDLAELKKSNLYGSELRYKRSKTGEEFCFELNTDALRIIGYFNSDSDYLFPILTEFHKTGQQKKDRIHKVQGQVNKALKEAAKVCDIDVNLTFYVARHTMATTLKRKQVSTDVIQQVMGHQDMRTTQIYLAKFGSEVINEAGKLL
ncbi:MAG: integrase/recombinase XerD [Saprospiraceae bacterium]|jgi:integrase/recombinase XerD